MTAIDFSKVPVEPTVDIIDNHGNVIVTTNNPIVLTYARVEIRHLKLEGWKVRTMSGLVINISVHGTLDYWPEGEITGCEEEKLLAELI